jgi:hypothetical protein
MRRPRSLTVNERKKCLGSVSRSPTSQARAGQHPEPASPGAGKHGKKDDGNKGKEE